MNKNDTFNKHENIKTNLLSLSYEEFENFIYNSETIPNTIINTLFKELHKHRKSKIEDIKLSKKNRTALSNIAYIPNLQLIKKTVSNDGKSIKYLFRLEDGYYIESVLLIFDGKVTVCVSSQSGCGLGCEFCATGMEGFNRDLYAWEIISQVYYIANDYSGNINNVVYMGMGEPLLNYDNVIKSAEILNNNYGLNISSQKISISTVGIVPAIERYIHENQPFHLILSLHSAIQSKREKLVPSAEKFKISDLERLIKLYYNKRRDWVTIAYTMIKNCNMYSEDIKALKMFLTGKKCKLNLIKYNSVESVDFESPDPGDVEEFYKSFCDLDLPVNIRKTTGQDINGACGQLAIKKHV